MRDSQKLERQRPYYEKCSCNYCWYHDVAWEHFLLTASHEDTCHQQRVCEYWSSGLRTTFSGRPADPGGYYDQRRFTRSLETPTATRPTLGSRPTTSIKHRRISRRHRRINRLHRPIRRRRHRPTSSRPTRHPRRLTRHQRTLDPTLLGKSIPFRRVRISTGFLRCMAPAFRI